MRELLGQPRLLERLGERLTSGEASHAYLISGPRSIGKHTLALRIAQTLTCGEGRRPGGCGICVACRKVERGLHPDVREIGVLRSEERRWISIEQLREMERDLALRPLEGSWRVVIIDDGADMREDAQDSLLKTLEEPPIHAVLLIVAQVPHALRPTIVSRCQPLALRPVSAERIAQYVARRTGDAALARLVAPLAVGRPGLALRLAADERERAGRLAMLDDLFALLGTRLIERFAWANHVAEEANRTPEDRELLGDRFTLWLELLRDATVPAAVARIHSDRAARTARLRDLVGQSQLRSLAALIARLRDDLDRNSNARTSLELAMLRLPYLAEFKRAA